MLSEDMENFVAEVVHPLITLTNALKQTNHRILNVLIAVTCFLLMNIVRNRQKVECFSALENVKILHSNLQVEKNFLKCVLLTTEILESHIVD